MQATIISDTSCLILLNKIGALHLLQKVFGAIVTTPQVADEYGSELPPWITIISIGNNKNNLILEALLDKGEASVIALALEKDGSLLIIDELKGRRLAKSLGLTITGTLGVLVQAKELGHIKSLRSLLNKIAQTDFRLSQQLVQETLKHVGE